MNDIPNRTLTPARQKLRVDIIKAEDDLMCSLTDWSKYGGPVISVIHAISKVIDARVSEALIARGVIVDRSDDI